jgi:hypothetical protein
MWGLADAHHASAPILSFSFTIWRVGGIELVCGLLPFDIFYDLGPCFSQPVRYLGACAPVNRDPGEQSPPRCFQSPHPTD